jgi:hypothetical protein
VFLFDCAIVLLMPSSNEKDKGWVLFCDVRPCSCSSLFYGSTNLNIPTLACSLICIQTDTQPADSNRAPHPSCNPHAREHSVLTPSPATFVVPGPPTGSASPRPGTRQNSTAFQLCEGAVVHPSIRYSHQWKWERKRKWDSSKRFLPCSLFARPEGSQPHMATHPTRSRCGRAARLDTVRFFPAGRD